YLYWHQKNFNEERQQQEEENAEANQAYHCHGYSHAYEDRKREQHQARRKLYAASVICIIFVVAEITGEYLCSKGAQLCAQHICTPALLHSLLVCSLWLSTSLLFLKFIEILGALMSMVIIWMVTGVLTYLASMRLLHPDYDIDAAVMLITSACAVFKAAAGCILAADKSEDLLITEKPDYQGGLAALRYRDLFLRAVIASCCKQRLHNGLSYDAVKARILAVEKVESVHNLHLWSLTMNQTILSAHVATADTVDRQKILKDITQALFEHYSFHSITIQIESGEDQKQNCIFCQEPRD
uniref:Solute carrier family 30 member 8 n=1 Tax=Pavo cristatus TaxID=9049 RepID=A0A8C9F2H6_PAVCR